MKVPCNRHMTAGYHQTQVEQRADMQLEPEA